MTKNHNLPKLEKNIEALQATLAKLASSDDFVELLRYIHQPGWTTIAEFYLVNGLVDNMHAQLRAFEQLQQTLMEGSRLIGEGIPTR
jgi:hypothetical protein